MGDRKRRKADRLRRKLRAAADGQHLVRIHRSVRRAGWVEGYVVGFREDDRWLLVAALDPGVFLDGWIAVRVRDVRRVQPRRGTEAFVRRALELHGEWPPAAPDGLELSGTRKLLTSAGRGFPLVVLHIEYRRPDVAYIGTPIGFHRRSVGLIEITPQATWVDAATGWKLRRLSRIDFGGRYEQALLDVAGPLPDDAAAQNELS